MNKITITGDLGSGKTVVSKLLSQALGYPIVSTGSIQRKMAAEMKLTTFELNELANDDDSIDKRIDATSRGLNLDPNPYIVDSRMSWFFIEKAYKIYLKVDPSIAAIRIFGDSNRSTESYSSAEEAFELLKVRRQTEIDRFMEKYGVDYTDLSHYDLTVVTNDLEPEQVAQIVLDQRSKWLQHADGPKTCMASPKSLYPLQHLGPISTAAAAAVKSAITKTGFNDAFPVAVVEHEGKLFIYDGHKRASSAILAGLTAIPIVIVAKGREEISAGMTAERYVKKTFDPASIVDWETVLRFRFQLRPSIEK